MVLPLAFACVSSATAGAQMPSWRKLTTGQKAILNAQSIACDSFDEFLARFKTTRDSRGCRRTAASSLVTLRSLRFWQTLDRLPMNAAVVKAQHEPAIAYVPDIALTPIAPIGTHLCVALFDKAHREITLTKATFVRMELPTKHHKVTIVVRPSHSAQARRMPIGWAFFNGYSLGDFIPLRLPVKLLGPTTDLYSCTGKSYVPEFFQYWPLIP